MGGGPRVCGTGPGAEGGDARRPCHGHAAAIGRLQRGWGLAARVAEAGEKRSARGRLRRAVAERGQGRAAGR
jgi:hypothetical protein